MKKKVKTILGNKNILILCILIAFILFDISIHRIVNTDSFVQYFTLFDLSRDIHKSTTLSTNVYSLMWYAIIGVFLVFFLIGEKKQLRKFVKGETSFVIYGFLSLSILFIIASIFNSLIFYSQAMNEVIIKLEESSRVVEINFNDLQEILDAEEGIVYISSQTKDDDFSTEYLFDNLSKQKEIPFYKYNPIYDKDDIDVFLQKNKIEVLPAVILIKDKEIKEILQNEDIDRHLQFRMNQYWSE